MKNHIMVDGQLLQTNKKWKDLRMSQKDFITNLIREEYFKLNEDTNTKLSKEKKEILWNTIMEKIKEGGTWIPEGEMKKELIRRVTKIERRR